MTGAACCAAQSAASRVGQVQQEGGQLTRRLAGRPGNLADGVTVVTVTRRRPELLERCIKSVSGQDYRGALRHLIIVDDCLETASLLARLDGNGRGRIRWVLAKRRATESSGPPRLAKLRNLAADRVDTTWTAFLDDDNEYEPHHIASLVDCAAATGCRAVHSYRRLFYFEGDPFLEARWPWRRDPAEARACYQELVSAGVLEAASNIVRDRVEVSKPGSGFMLVDTSEWLIRTEVLRRVRIPRRFSYQDWLQNLAEDDKLVAALVAAGIKIGCSKQPSLRYYLGGYSSDLKGEYSHSESWLFNGHRRRRRR